MLTRRVFLRGSAVAMAGMGAVPSWLARAAAVEGKKRKTLVVIFQRGAADGLNIVIPFSEKRYRELRPTLAIAPPTGQTAGLTPAPNNATIDLDGQFALNGAMQPLKALWEKQQLAIVEATGSPDPSRSHFDAQDYMESGTPGKPSGDGWLNRALPPADAETSPLRAVALGNQVPHTLRGQRDVIAVNNSQQYQMGNRDAAEILQEMYSTSGDAQVGHTGKEAFEAMKMIQSITQAPNNGPGGAQYGQGGDLGRNLQQLARMIKADVGVEAAFAEIGGWDHHGNENQQLSTLLRQFSNALAAFSQDMGDRMEDIVLVTMSEFGRTAQENGNAGTDHGHGSLMMVLGGPVRGGKVYGQWPGLEKEQLFEGRDLAVTTDFRAVLSELIRGHLGQKDLGPVFPGYKPSDPLGLLRS
ncbi:MAG TPA: DUF1501 domain-containing protein [Bryobacteraceae bacterium]|jgi:uncharacterized protein (DUF1501 family)